MNKWILLILALFVSSGCSSIVSDSKYAVSINSEPPKSSFVLKNNDGIEVHSGITPTTVTLDASSGFFQGETYTLELRKNGFLTKTIEIDSSIDGWYFGNLLFGGFIGLLIVDPATGAMFSLPEKVVTNLDVDPDSLTISSIDSLTKEQKMKLVKLH